MIKWRPCSMQCPFHDPCGRYLGLLADRDQLQREVERLRGVIGNVALAIGADEYATLGEKAEK